VTHWLHILVLTLLALTAFVIVRLRGLWGAVMLTGIYSLLSASWMLLLDAPDVAFTEASVGAGIATILMLGTLSLTTTRAKTSRRTSILPLAIVTMTGLALVYGTLDMPHYGDPEAPATNHMSPEFIADNVPRGDGEPLEVGIPNIVTTVLASYRGYDTLGETAVILTAGVAVMILLRRRRRPGNDA
jgi:multicomponent Na+:H+ antiporter subunit B